MVREITFFVNGHEVRAVDGVSVLEGARQAGFYIPFICWHPIVGPSREGGCGLCIVEIEGFEGYPKACLTPVKEEMRVRTDTPEITMIRQRRMELLLSRHPYSCLLCPKRGTPECNPAHLVHIEGAKPCVLCRKNEKCELQKVTQYVGIKKISVRSPSSHLLPSVEGFIERDPRLCILCGRCVRVCQEVCGAAAIGFILRNGEIAEVGPVKGSLKDSGCCFCGFCIEVCPTAALMDTKVAPATKKGLIPCSEDCPVGVDVPHLLSLVGQRRFGDAAAFLRASLPLAGVLARVCTNPCEASCRRAEVNEAIAIRALERFALEAGGGDWQPPRKRPTGKQVAVIGSGPCGLACGYYLALMGHKVVIFEACTEPGGGMKIGIPSFVLPTQVLRNEIELIEKAGVEIRTSTEVKSLDALYMQGYDAIFVATGVRVRWEIGLKKEGLSAKLEDVVSFLSRTSRQSATTPLIRPEVKAALVGISRGAIAAARTLLRWLTPDVRIVFEGNEADIHADTEYVKEALKEGIAIETFTRCVKITESNGNFVLSCVRTKLGKRRDKDGRRIAEPVEGSEFDMPVDYLIMAEGEKLEVPEGFGLALGDGGFIETNAENMMTSRKGVFAGGAVAGAKRSVLDAVSAGKKAAIYIDRFLGGEVAKETHCSEEADLWLGKKDGFAYQGRVRTSSLFPEERVKSLAEEAEILGEEDAVREASRCLRCDLRLRVREMYL